MRSLVWFRSDLRTHDNPALSAAIEEGSRDVQALFVVCLEQWREHDWGATKIDFVLRSVDQLSRRLADLGVPLAVRRVDWFGDVPGLLTRLGKEMGFDAVFANREYEVNERRRDRLAERALEASGRPIHWFHEQLVVPPGELRTGAGDPYSVFSPFRRAWTRYLEENGIPEECPTPDPLSGRRQRDPSPPSPDALEPRPGVDEAIASAWPAGESEAQRRLALFVEERLSSYKEQRDIASQDATSRLSPYLAVGSLSVRSCLHAALEANRGQLSGGNPGIDTWIGELVWREFYRHVLVGFPRVSKGRAFRKETEKLEWRDSEEDLSAWCEGRTGIPFVDAGMRELLATGWMHNRLRMVTAMFLTKDLLIDWRQGERFFMRHLVDGDLANNNGGWQWSASTGTDAAPYFRIFNPWTQSKRYDPDAEYIRRWCPELVDVPASDIHDPERLARHLEATGYPAPVVNHKSARVRAVKAFERIKEAA